MLSARLHHRRCRERDCSIGERCRRLFSGRLAANLSTLYLTQLHRTASSCTSSSPTNCRPPRSDCSAAEPAGPSTPSAGRTPADLAADLADADALVVRSATKVDEQLHRRRAEASGDRPRRHRRRQRRRRRRQRARHPRHERARRQQRQRRRARAGADAVAGPLGAGRRRGDEDAASGKRRSSPAPSCAARRSASPGSAASARKSRSARVRSACDIVAHDPFISETGRGGARRRAADARRAVRARRLHHASTCPSTPETRHLFNATRLAKCKRGIRIINTARGELIDEAALRRAPSSRGHVAGAGARRVRDRAAEGLARWRSCRRSSRRRTSPRRPAKRRSWSASRRPRRCATSCATASSATRSTFPSIAADEMQRLQPCMRLAERLGALVVQLADGRTEAIGVRYYGPLVERATRPASPARRSTGVLRPMLSSGVTVVNARAVAEERGIEIVESQSSRPANFANLHLGQAADERRRALGRRHGVRAGQPAAVAARRRRRRSAARGHVLVIENNDQPGVIGEVGTMLGRHGQHRQFRARARRGGRGRRGQARCHAR